jgi:hypothetical protein
MALDAAVERRERHSAVERTRHRQWEDTVRARFVSLVQEILASGCSSAALDGNTPDPAIMWIDLKRDTTYGLNYLETFRLSLGVTLGELIGPKLDDGNEPISSEQWVAARRDAGQRMLAMMAEYRVQTLLQ